MRRLLQRHVLRAAAFAVVLVYALPGLALPIASWTFADGVIVAAPDERITVYATISNDASATDPLVFTTMEALGGSGAPPGGGSPLDAAYRVELVRIVFLRAVQLDPGESMVLPWADLIPLSSATPAATYGPAEARIDFQGLVVEADALFTVTVVPEPTTGMLVALGLALVGARGARREPRGSPSARGRRAPQERVGEPAR